MRMLAFAILAVAAVSSFAATANRLINEFATGSALTALARAEAKAAPCPALLCGRN